MAKTQLDHTAENMLAIAQLSLKLGRIDRAPRHEDGITAESDTDHTVMLALMAMNLADRYYPNLNQGLVAQFALVHDLVEAYVGDTPTLGISDQGRQQKERREEQAKEQLKKEFGAGAPLIPQLIERYEQRQEPEARFVKAIDILIPKVVWSLGLSAQGTIELLGLRKIQVQEFHAQEKQDKNSVIYDFPAIAELRDYFSIRSLESIAD